jgi:proteasome lid subunit RPN8/RPN11
MRINILPDFSRISKKKALRPPKPPPHHDLIENMRMKTQVYQDIKNTIGSRPAESGGLLMSYTRDYTITCFVLDIAAAKNSSVYQPDTAFLNSVLKGRNDEFVGIVHSHPGGARYLTTQDQRAAWSNLTSPGNPHLNAYLMPLIQTIPDTGRFEIIPFIVTCHPKGNGRVEVCRVELEIID